MLFFWCFSLFSQNKKLSITIDDLLAVTTDETQYEYITDNILKSLTAYNIPAIGFVNESRLYTNGVPDTAKIELLERWLKAKMDLGNHTFSHVYIDNTTLEDYKKDVLKGEFITRQLIRQYGKELKYFRHPQLRTGPTDEYRIGLTAFLQEQGYKTAPVTVDNDEYIYAYCYAKANVEKDTVMMLKIAEDYLVYMEKVFVFYEKLSVDFLGYEVPQTLLIHSNLLNADYLDELIGIMRERKYTFVSLDETLKDKAYSLPEGTHSRGLSWIHRWMIEAGQTPESHPEVSQFIREMFQKYRRG